MFKNEEDVADTVLRHLFASGVDHVIVADNLSDDRTPHILNDLQATGFPLTIVEDRVLAYDQAGKMSRLARQAYEIGATWVLPFDADEIWYGVDPATGEACRIADALSHVDPEIQVIRAPGWDHIAEAWKVEEYAVNHDCWYPFSPFRRADSQKLAKVAFRAHPDARLHMGNHDVTLPGPSIIGPLAFRHFQYRSLEQMTRKLRQGREAYEASDIHPMHGTHWRAGGLKTDAELEADWAALCAEDGLIFDPAPILA